MTTDVEERLSNIRVKQNEAERRRARAEAQRDEAVSRRQKAEKALLEEFEVKNVAEAQKLLVRLQKETDSVLAEIEEQVQGL